MVNSLFPLENQLSKTKYQRTVYGPGINIQKMFFNNLALDLKFDDSSQFEKLLTFVIDNLNFYFKKKIEDQIYLVVVKSGNAFLNETLSNISLIGEIMNTGIYLDYSLTDNSPVILNNALELSFNASVFNNDTTVNTTNSSVIPHFTNTSKQVEIFVNQYVVDSALSALQKTDKLKFYLNSTSINSSLIKLDTTYLGLFISNLSETYGKDKNVDISCTSFNTPSFKIQENKSIGNFFESCKFIVVEKNETAFTANISINGEFDVYLEKGFLKGEFKNFTIQQLTVVQSNIGNLDGNKLENFLNFAVGVLLPIINNQIFQKTGIELPSIQGLSFKDTYLFLKEGYVQLEMNPLFDNSSLRYLY